MKKYTDAHLLAEALRGALMAKRKRELAKAARKRRATHALAKAAPAQPAPPSIYNLTPEAAAVMKAIKAVHSKGADFPHGSPFGLLRI